MFKLNLNVEDDDEEDNKLYKNLKKINLVQKTAHLYLSIFV